MTITHDPLHVVLSRLKGVQQTGDSYEALCPAHDDSTPSLSVRRGDDGRVLLHCHANCLPEAVCKAIDLTLRDLFTTKIDQRESNRGRIVKIYDYADAEGQLVHQTVRYEPKGFKQRRPDGNGGWQWNLKGVKRLLYRLPELIAAPADAIVYLPEGEKDADNLAERDLIATTCPMGAGKWKHLHDDSVLHGRSIAILIDKDDEGRKHGLDVATKLYGKVREVRIVELPGPGKDVSDWLEAGGTAQQLQDLVKATTPFTPAGDNRDDGDDEKQKPRESHSTKLLRLCEDVEFFHDDDTGYASIRVDDHLETVVVRSGKFRRWLSRLFYETEDRAPSSQALADSINVLDGKAHFKGPQIKVHVRLAEHEGSIYLDLADPKRQIIEMTASGWRVITSAPVRFRRPKGLIALPMPALGGSLAELRLFINLPHEKAFVLLVAWLVATLRPNRPIPLLAINSEQGSGKSTATRIVRLIVDPNTAAIRCAPRDPRDLMIAASNGLIIALDNLSNVPDWLSDALCRLSTGGGFSTRVLYENDEEQLFDALRPVILNGIEDLGSRSDLLDRTIRIALPSIPEIHRRQEREIYELLEEARPRLLGALLTAACTALSRLDKVKLNRLPRMADFVTWVVAAEPALPWQPGAFLQAYLENRGSAHELALEASSIADAVRQLLGSSPEWTGTASQLLTALNALVPVNDQKAREWPKQANVLSGQLRRIAPNLRACGIEVEFPDRSGKRRLISIRSQAQIIVTTVTDRHSPVCGHENGIGCDDPPPPCDDPHPMIVTTECPDFPSGDDGDGGDDQMHHLSDEEIGGCK